MVYGKKAGWGGVWWSHLMMIWDSYCMMNGRTPCDSDNVILIIYLFLKEMTIWRKQANSGILLRSQINFLLCGAISPPVGSEESVLMDQSISQPIQLRV